MAAKKGNTGAARDKAADFKRLAGARVPKAIKAIRVVSKLGNKAAYTYTDAQAAKIVAVLREEVDALEKQLASGKQAVEGVTFEL